VSVSESGEVYCCSHTAMKHYKYKSKLTTLKEIQAEWMKVTIG
jgi:hypothetical protein